MDWGWSSRPEARAATRSGRCGAVRGARSAYLPPNRRPVTNSAFSPACREGSDGSGGGRGEVGGGPVGRGRRWERLGRERTGKAGPGRGRAGGGRGGGGRGPR